MVLLDLTHIPLSACWSSQELRFISSSLIESSFCNTQIRGEVVGYDEERNVYPLNRIGVGIKVSQVIALVPEMCVVPQGVVIMRFSQFLLRVPYIGLH